MSSPRSSPSATRGAIEMELTTEERRSGRRDPGFGRSAFFLLISVVRFPQPGDERIAMKRAWTLDGKKVWLHPPFWSRKRWHPVRLAIRDAEWLPGGEWWPVFRDRSGEVIASEVPGDNVASIEACPEREEGLRIVADCELVDSAPALSVVVDDHWTEAQIEALLEDPFTKTRERLARRYWFSEELRRVVAQHIVHDQRESRALRGAMDLAALGS